VLCVLRCRPWPHGWHNAYEEVIWHQRVTFIVMGHTWLARYGRRGVVVAIELRPVVLILVKPQHEWLHLVESCKA